jgi:hypothetical protein
MTDTYLIDAQTVTTRASANRVIANNKGANFAINHPLLGNIYVTKKELSRLLAKEWQVVRFLTYFNVDAITVEFLPF